MKFKTKIVQSGNNTGISVPAKIIESMGAGKKPLVVISVNKYTYRSAVALMKGLYMISLSAENRQNAGVKGGDEVEINIELDTKPRIVELPSDFKKSLDKNPAAKKSFELLSNSKKKWLVIPITSAKTDETRVRRIEKAIELLKADKV